MKIYYKDKWGENYEVTSEMLIDEVSDNFSEWVSSIDQETIRAMVKKPEQGNMLHFYNSVAKEIIENYVIKNSGLFDDSDIENETRFLMTMIQSKDD